MPRNNREKTCFAFKPGYGVFPIASMDFDSWTAKDYSGREHEIISLGRVVILNKNRKFRTVESGDNNDGRSYTHGTNNI